ncbi:MAG: DUF1566 domain-containing protein [Xanthomonadales bacterium]|nr:DUF1566 domain-containing protein [Xanthomonadales bacterium]
MATNPRKPAKWWAVPCVLASALLMASLSVQAAEQHCQSGVGKKRASTPTTEFVLNQDGTVVHNRTGLQWARCSLGQTWEGSRCTGQAAVYSWDDATDAVAQLNGATLGGHSDWRLPTAQELMSIVEQCRQAPAININVFPDTPRSGYWTGTIHRGSSQPTFVGFHLGLEQNWLSHSSYRVRPVRAVER